MWDRCGSMGFDQSINRSIDRSVSIDPSIENLDGSKPPPPIETTTIGSTHRSRWFKWFEPTHRTRSVRRCDRSTRLDQTTPPTDRSVRAFQLDPSSIDRPTHPDRSTDRPTGTTPLAPHHTATDESNRDDDARRRARHRIDRARWRWTHRLVRRATRRGNARTTRTGRRRRGRIRPTPRDAPRRTRRRRWGRGTPWARRRAGKSIERARRARST